MENTQNLNLEEITVQVKKLANKVGEFEQKEFLSFGKENIKQKHDLVSYVDLESEKQLIEGLRNILPNAGFITEEQHSRYKDGLNWIVDPIDGTTNFVEGIPHFCISIALAKANEILVGLVLNPMSGECFYTWQNAPSYCNGLIINVSGKESLSNALVATGFSVKNNSQLANNLKLLETWIKETRGVRRFGSAALDLCWVAKGIFDFYYETNLSAWDVAAGALLVKNAGGSVSDFANQEKYLFGDEILASNRKLHNQVVAKLDIS